MISQTNSLTTLQDGLLPLLSRGDSFTFPNFISDLCSVTEEAIRNMIKSYLETLDSKFRNSPGRCTNYHVKDTVERTIITMYGEITYKRTIYKDLNTGGSFCYVDSKMGIDKYVRYTNDVGSYVYDAYADENSMIKVGQEVGGLIAGKFHLKDKRDYAIPRQTIYNLIKRVKEIRKLPKGELKDDVKDIYLLFDEKYIPCQDKLNEDEERKDMMVKFCLIVEGLDTSDSKRHKYKSPYYLTFHNKNITEQIEDFLNNKYDMDKVEKIHILSDGGTWIGGVYSDLLYPRKKKIKYLDKFHAFKAVWNITLDDELYAALIKLLFTNKRDEFFKVINGLKDVFKDRKEIIEANRKYLSNHWAEIRNTLRLKEMNCAMEQVISHHIASEFTSVPKAYCSSNINRYLSMRDNFRNGENLKLLYLYGLENDEDEVVIINKPKLDQSRFNGNEPLNNFNSLNRSGKPIEEDPTIERGQEDYN